MANTGKVKISWIEATSILTVSQIFSTVAFSIETQNGLSPISCMIAFVAGSLLNFIIILPFFLLIKKYGYSSLIDFTYRTSKFLGCILTISIFILFISVICSTITTFNSFITTSVFENSPPFTIIALLVLAASYGAFLGIEALGRFANIVFVLVTFAIIIILLSVVKNVEVANFGGFSIYDFKNILKTAIQGVLSNTGVISAVIITPVVSKKHFKGFAFWNLASLILVEIIAFCTTGVLGEYAVEKPFPYYSTATVAELSIFTRLDAVYMCVWVLVAFVKTTYYLTLSSSLLDTILKNKAKKYSLFFCSALILIISAISSTRPILNKYIQNFIFSGGVFIASVIILPLVIMIISLVKGKKQNV